MDMDDRTRPCPPVSLIADDRSQPPSFGTDLPLRAGSVSRGIHGDCLCPQLFTRGTCGSLGLLVTRSGAAVRILDAQQRSPIHAACAGRVQPHNCGTMVYNNT